MKKREIDHWCDHDSCVVLFLPLFLFFSSLLSCPVCAQEKQTSQSGHKWAIPGSEELQQELGVWLEAIAISPIQQEQIFERWNRKSPVSAEQRFNCLIDSLRTVSTPIATFLEQCDELEWSEPQWGVKRSFPTLPCDFLPGKNSFSPRLGAALRFYLVQRLVRTQRLDEAFDLLETLNPELCIDPLSVLLFRAMICNQRLDKTGGLTAIRDFRATLPSDSGVSRRVLELAKLLEMELNSLGEEEDSLPNISRRLSELRRRLGLGEIDQPVQQLGEQVVQSLDRLIERLENGQDGNGGQSSEHSGSDMQPGERSRIARQKGEGEVGDRSFSNEDNWGNLPAKDREETLLWIEKEFSSHYRNIIEQYFRQLANEK